MASIRRLRSSDLRCPSSQSLGVKCTYERNPAQMACMVRRGRPQARVCARTNSLPLSLPTNELILRYRWLSVLDKDVTALGLKVVEFKRLPLIDELRKALTNNFLLALDDIGQVVPERGGKIGALRSGRWERGRSIGSCSIRWCLSRNEGSAWARTWSSH